MNRNNVVQVMPGTMTSYGGVIYFTNMWNNALYSMNPQNGEAKVLVQIDVEPFFLKDLYADLVIGDDMLFCVPHNAMNIGVYNIKKSS